MKLTKIPKQLFVVSKAVNETAYDYDADGNYIGNHVAEVHNFGFLHPHESTKADAKRKETQLSWAYSGQVYQEGDVWRRKGFEWAWVPGGPRQGKPFDVPIEIAYAPRIWDNVPLSGFKIIDTVCRYRGNKLFKVLDPRGVEFEITAASLFNIIMNGRVENGEILDTCVWKANKNLVVVKDLA